MKDKTDFYCTVSQGFLQARQRADLLFKAQADNHYKKGEKAAHLLC